MKTVVKVLVAFAVTLMAVSALAQPQRIVLPQGTSVVLAFDQSLSSKTAKVGDVIKLHVVNSVMANGRTIIARGTSATAVIGKVDHRTTFGVNAKIRLALNPIMSSFGKEIPVQARSKGQYVGGSQSTKAGAASAGGAIALGPVGLVGGYFVHGKRVEIHRGDKLVTEVSREVVLR